MSAFILWLLVGAADGGLCGEIRTAAFAAASSETRNTSPALAQHSDAVQGAVIPAGECDPARKRQQVLQHEQERNSAEAMTRALTSSLRAELDALQSKTEAARIEHSQALGQQRERAEALGREVAALAEGDTARITSREAARTIDLGIKQTEALEQERDKAHHLAHELGFVREVLEAARLVVSKAVQSVEADIQRDQALAIERDRAENLACEVATLRVELDKAQIAASEAGKAAPTPAEHAQALDRERTRADALARELSSARAEAAKSAAAEIEQRTTLEQTLKQQQDEAKDRAREFEAATVEHNKALEKERDRSDALARELASARKQVDERSARLAAAYAEALQVTETNRANASEDRMALGAERERADAIARDLASARDRLDAANRQLAALKASSPLTLVDGLPEWVATSLSAVAERPPRYVPDEHRLLALATILLRRSDISRARPLLEHAAWSGSARAAFMLAETYDRRMLPSWRARRLWGNASKALELYEMAQSGGMEDASKRIKGLQRASVRSSRAQFR